MRFSGPFLELDVTAEPASPPAGKVRLFVKSDGHMYLKDSAGVVRQVTIPVGTVAPTGAAVDHLWVDTT